MLVFMLESAALITTKFMTPAACAMPGVLEHADERTLRDDLDAGMRPRRRGHDDRHGEHVEQEQPQQHGAQRRRDGALRIARLAGGDGDDLDAVEGEDPDDHRHPHPGEPLGKEAAGKPGEIVQAGGRVPDAEDAGRTQDDEQHDRRHLDQREPGFDRPEVAHRARVEIQQHQRRSRAPTSTPARPGNQNAMYSPAATASPPMAITCAIQ